MRFLGRSLTGLLLFAVTLGLLGLSALTVGNALRGNGDGGGPGRPAAERVVAAPVVAIVPGPVTPVITAFGRVEARRTLELRSPQAGTVIWVAENFRNGLLVTEGEVLVRLDPAEAQEALALAEADLAEARAAVSEAAMTLALAAEDLAAAQVQADLRRQALLRQQDIAARGAGSPQAVETAELAVSSADQAVLSRRQALAQAEARADQAAIAVTRAEIAAAEAARALAETELRAGLSGRIDGAGLVPGAVLTANEAIGRIIDPTALDVTVRLSTAQAGRLLDASGALLDLAVEVLPAARDATPVTGRLDRLGAAVAEGQTGRLVYVSLAAGPGLVQMQPGDFVTVRLTEPPLPDAAVLPALALGGDGTVLVLGADDRLEPVAVSILRRQGDEVIIDAAGLAGREVVTERSALLGAGIRIRPIRPEAAGLVPLDDARRAALVDLVEASPALSETEKAQLRQDLQAEAVPAALIDRLEGRMGG